MVVLRKVVGRVVGAVAHSLWLLALACSPQPSFFGEVVKPVEKAPPIVATNWNGSEFHLSDLDGKVAIVSFGYTYCPDVCPMTMTRMKELYARLGEAAQEFAYVLVSVDPARDTQEKLAQYVPAFDPRFYGLHLDGQALTAAIEGYDITVRESPRENSGGYETYTVDHTGTYFVIDRRGRLRLKFPPNTAVDVMLPDIQRLLEE